MAIGTPGQRAIGDVTGQTATTAFSPGTSIASGSVAILSATGNVNKIISSVADSVGNTWVVDATASDGARTASSASCQVVSTIGTGATITITWSVATSGIMSYWVHEVSGLAASSVFDTSASGTGTGTALATSSTATLAQADELVWGIFRTSGAIGGSWTKGASYTDPTTPRTLTNASSALEYKIVAATTAVLADGTWSASGSWVGLCVTYEGVGAAPQLSTPFRGGGFRRA